MIASRKDRKAENDNYRALALYIADTKNEGEKVLLHWSAGCSFEDYLAGISEVEAVQSRNTRSKLSKTYHLVVSFRPEDEAKLSAEDFIEIEKAFAEALGFSDHQRHCGVHQNTDHLHLHVAYNQVDKEKFRMRSPYYDFFKLSQICRAVEKKYGLTVDRGAEPEISKKEGRASARVKSIEAQTGQESLFSYIIRHKDDLLKEIGEAVSWADIHAAFLKKGLLLKPSGNGLTIQGRYGKHRAKPSQVDQNLSKARLEKRFGEYQAPSAAQLRDSKALETYSAIPLHRGPERDNLYAIFQEELSWRRTALAEICQESRTAYEAHKQKWGEKRKRFKRIPMMRRDRDNLLMDLSMREREELEKIRSETAGRRDTVRALVPYTSWNKCLQHKAALGNEVALAILRSKGDVVQPEIISPHRETAVNKLPEVRQWDNTKEILKADGLSNRNWRALLSVLKMREVLSRENEPQPELEYQIDGRGTVIFHLPGGGTIRDTGRQIHFSHHDKSASDLALKYAQKRWGTSLDLSDGIIKWVKSSEKAPQDKLHNYGPTQ